MRRRAVLLAALAAAFAAAQARATTVLIRPASDDGLAEAFPQALAAISLGQPRFNEALAAHLETVSPMEPAEGRAWLADAAARAPKGTPRNAAYWLSKAFSSPGLALGMQRYLNTLADGPRLAGIFERLAASAFEKEETASEPRLDGVSSSDGARQAQESLGKAASLHARGALWEHSTEPLSVDAEPAGRAPGYHFGHATRVEKGPWSAGIEGRFSFFSGKAREGGGGEHSVELEVKRRAGREGFLIGELEWARDSFVGMRNRLEARVGYGRELLDTPRHELEVEASIGPVRERFYGGGMERFLSPGLAAEYAFKPGTAWRISQKVVTDFTLKEPGEVEEVRSVTEVAYRLSRALSLRAAHHFRLLGEPVPGFPSSVSGTTFGVVLNR